MVEKPVPAIPKSVMKSSKKVNCRQISLQTPKTWRSPDLLPQVGGQPSVPMEVVSLTTGDLRYLRFPKNAGKVITALQITTRYTALTADAGRFTLSVPMHRGINSIWMLTHPTEGPAAGLWTPVAFQNRAAGVLSVSFTGFVASLPQQFVFTNMP